MQIAAYWTAVCLFSVINGFHIYGDTVRANSYVIANIPFKINYGKPGFFSFSKCHLYRLSPQAF
jgi:hypothetical protein